MLLRRKRILTKWQNQTKLLPTLLGKPYKNVEKPLWKQGLFFLF